MKEMYLSAHRQCKTRTTLYPHNSFCNMNHTFVHFQLLDGLALNLLCKICTSVEFRLCLVNISSKLLLPVFGVYSADKAV